MKLIKRQEKNSEMTQLRPGKRCVKENISGVTYDKCLLRKIDFKRMI
jgi:hypothetical protein